MGDRPALVLVDCRMARRRRTGGARYARGLVAHAEGVAPAGDIRVRTVTGPPPLPRRNALTSVGNLLLDLVWTHLALPLLAVRHRAAAVHSTFNWAPAWTPCPRIVTVHDLSWERRPQDYPRAFRTFARLFTRMSARRATRVIAVSHATADDLARLYGVPRERLTVVYTGLENPGPRETATTGDPNPFILHVGEFEPRKRVPALVEGHRRYLRDAPTDPAPCRLVLVGAGGADEPAVDAAVAAHPGCERAGFVDDAALKALYRSATLLVMPSRWEGFGLPVAEALLAGCPVLVADTPALREAAGPEGLVIDEPCDPDAITAALAAALGDRDGLGARGLRGRAHADLFTWERCVSDTVAVYRDVINESGGAE